MSRGIYDKVNKQRIPIAGAQIPNVDNVLLATSENPVQNRILKSAIDNKQDLLNFDNTPTIGSTNPVTSDGIKKAIDSITPMTGATSSTSGTAGLVPAPAVGDEEKFLRGDGTWQTVQSGVDIPIGDVSGASVVANQAQVTIKWTDPVDVEIDNIPFAVWAGTVVVRKLGSAPESATDGTIITTNTVRNQYSNIGFIDNNNLTYGNTYYYRFFPYKMNGSTRVYTAGTALNVVITRTPISITPSQNGNLTYNTSSQSPSWDNYDSTQLTLGGVTEGVNAGNYVATFTPKSGYCWTGGSTTAREVTWSIGQADGSITLNKNNISLDTTTTSDTVTVTNTTGTITASSDNTAVATVSVNNNIITITGVSNGSAVVTVAAAASSDGNYKATSTTISVSVSFASLVSWSSGTDEQIEAMINAYYDGTFSLADVQTVWHIGDTRNVTLSAMSATGVGESHRSQTVQLQILGFAHDDLTTTINDKTKALITVDLKNCLRDANVSDTGGTSNTEHGYMNSSNTNQGGWTSCARRTWCNNVFFAALPSWLQGLVKYVNKKTSAGNQSSTINTDSDRCFLLSEIEIFGSTTYSKTGEGSQYAWYANATANKYKLPKWSSSSVSDLWWKRSPDGSSSTGFCFVSNNGDANYSSSSYARGLAPALAL